MIQEPNVIFFGTPSFAVGVFEVLVEQELIPQLVITMPDRPKGRGLKLTPSPMRIIAEEHQIPVHTPENLSDEKNIGYIKSFDADVFVIAAYGKILPKKILDIPKHGVINVHPSLLPKYRGASPIQTALMRGETETGVTIMLTDEEMDHGPIVSQRSLLISDYDTGITLESKLAQLGGTVLSETLVPWINGVIAPKEQEHNKATFTKILTKAAGRIDWSMGATDIHNQVRALQPWPMAWTIFKKNTLELRAQLIETRVSESAPGISSGTVKTENGDLYIAAGDCWLQIFSIKLEGRNVTSGEQVATQLLGFRALSPSPHNTR